MNRASIVTPLPCALSTATPSSCDPADRAANSRPPFPWQLISTTGGPPVTYVGAEVPSMVTALEMAGSLLDSAMIPCTEKSMTEETPAELASARLIAARSEPDPELDRFVTKKNCEDASASAAVVGWRAGSGTGPLATSTAATPTAAQPLATQARTLRREGSGPIRPRRVKLWVSVGSSILSMPPKQVGHRQ